MRLYRYFELDTVYVKVKLFLEARSIDVATLNLNPKWIFSIRVLMQTDADNEDK